jgi:hypothetical protein
MNTSESNETQEIIEINPRTGLPYKQSAKLREQKRKWTKNNRDIINCHSCLWQLRNKEKMAVIQANYYRRKKERLKAMEEEEM